MSRSVHGTSSADPATLDNYRSGSEEVGDRVLRVAGELEQAVGVLQRGGSVGVPNVGGAVDMLVRSEAAQRRLAGWVGEVATAFRRADWGGLPNVPRADDPATDRLAALFAIGRAPIPIAEVVELLLGLGPDAPADELRAFAAVLPPELGAQLATEHPELVGPVEGWPVALRFAANRELIRRDLATAEGARRAQLEALLAPDPATGLARQILLYDGRGDGRVAEVFGDLDRALDIAFYVPGMSTDLDHFDGRVAGRAGRLYEEALAQDADRPLAVIGWLGYDSPDDLPSMEVASDHLARVGASALQHAVDGLAAGDDRHISIVAHSYGTVVTAFALAAGIRADNVLVMGSPGMLVDRGSQFGRGDETDLFTMEAPGDLVTRLERFGADPNRADSGFTRLETEGHGHSGYLAAGSLSLFNAVAVIRDDDHQLHERSDDVGEQLDEPLRVLRRGQLFSIDLIERLQRRFPSRADGAIDAGETLVDSVNPVRIAQEQVEDAIEDLGSLVRLVE